MDPHWNSDIERTYEELKELATSSDPDERLLAAAMYTLPEDLVELLANDRDSRVVESSLMQWSASEQTLTDAVAKHPELAAQVALHDNAPVHLFRLKPVAYANEAQLDRFLKSVNATRNQGESMKALALKLDSNPDISQSVEQVWNTISQ